MALNRRPYFAPRQACDGNLCVRGKGRCGDARDGRNLLDDPTLHIFCSGPGEVGRTIADETVAGHGDDHGAYLPAEEHVSRDAMHTRLLRPHPVAAVDAVEKQQKGANVFGLRHPE